MKKNTANNVKPNKWRCGACGYVLEVDIPPDICPSCHNKCEFIDDNCYTPDCGCTKCNTL